MLSQFTSSFYFPFSIFHYDSEILDEPFMMRKACYIHRNLQLHYAWQLTLKDLRKLKHRLPEVDLILE
jgi:hypothetical protein